MRAYLPLIHYENWQCGLRAAKVLLHEGAIIASEATRRPLGPLPKLAPRSNWPGAATRSCSAGCPGKRDPSAGEVSVER